MNAGVANGTAMSGGSTAVASLGVVSLAVACCILGDSCTAGEREFAGKIVDRWWITASAGGVVIAAASIGFVAFGLPQHLRTLDAPPSSGGSG
ncbi:hypothetical protein PLANPX_1215 [Lacipirellula parvula]|uniref:Uncharacterized protein n=1 Tax=Lacipirellula parvula TaxID=2650471 RepID=A0A5K7XBB4_9BACT|nr:hypothetical protein PLANPX_1215 [Lacipirellula parvula]